MKYVLKKGGCTAITDDKLTRDAFLKHGFKLEEPEKKKAEKKKEDKGE